MAYEILRHKGIDKSRTKSRAATIAMGQKRLWRPFDRHVRSTLNS